MGQLQITQNIFVKPSYLACLMLVFAIMLSFSHYSAVAEKLPIETLTLHTDTGAHKFQVEIADNDATQAKGLMFRRSLPDDHGMLFIYNEEDVLYMWMKNTFISLDMVFIKADGTVFSIAKNTEPFSEDVVSSGEPGLAVLEVNAGTADRLNLKIGDKISHRFFENTKE